MKGPARSLVLLPAALVAGACAGTARVPEMPAWSPDSLALVAAASPRDIDDDDMRVPRDEEPRDIWQASGLYVGGALITSWPMDDFDGGQRLVLSGGTATDEVLVPDLDIGGGAGLYIAYRWRMNEVVLQYSITEHDGEGQDGMGVNRDLDTTIRDLDLTWRHYWWESSPLQPYGLLGVVLHSEVDIEDGSTDTGTLQPVDAELSDGIGINLGAGAALYTLPWVMFYGQGMYRFLRYETARGFAGEFATTPDIDADGWVVSFGAAVRLIPPRH